MKNLKINTLAILAILAISSCSKKDDPIKQPDPVNEEEVITTVTTVFTPVGSGSIVTLKYRDIDGDGPGAPEPMPNVTFEANKTYNGVITVLNESVTPAKIVSTEILAEAVDHQFFYQSTGSFPSLTYTPVTSAPDNFDTNGKPLGFKTSLVTGSTVVNNGALKVTLRHQGNKSAVNVSNGDITNATGATDFDINYTGLKIQ